MDEKPKRRWFQFGLSTWFVIVAVISTAFVKGPDWLNLASFHYHSVPVEWQNRYLLEVIHELVLGSLLLTAVAAFVGWKAAWAVGERRRDRRATLG